MERGDRINNYLGVYKAGKEVAKSKEDGRRAQCVS